MQLSTHFFAVVSLIYLQDSSCLCSEVWIQKEVSQTTRRHGLYQALISVTPEIATNENSSSCLQKEDVAVPQKQSQTRHPIHSNGHQTNNNPTRTSATTTSSSHDQESFRQHLKDLARRVRNRQTRANRMDDELRRMEIAFYGLDPSQDNRLECRYPRSVSYRGPVVEPDIGCYAMVANAYAKAGLYTIGAEQAEQVYDRCDTNCQSQRPNKLVKTACMNAWIHADDWDEATKWLERMEDDFQNTQQQEDAPDTITYTQFLEGLASSKTLTAEESRQRCNEILNKMHDQVASGVNSYANPNRFTYIAAMKCQAKRQPQGHDGNGTPQETGMQVVKRVEELLREMEHRYEETGDCNLKPNAYCYVPVANAAARCQGGIEAAKHAEALLWEMKDKYTQTGDRNYIPIEGIYTACFTAYARVEPEHAAEASQRVRLLLQELESNQEYQRPLSLHAYTAAINGLVVDNTRENLKEAEAILRRMPKRDAVAYQSVLMAFAKSGNAAKADRLLWELQEYSTKQDGDDRRVSAPDVVTLAACVNAWVKSKEKNNIDEALEHAEKLLHLIAESFKMDRVLPHHRNVGAWIFEKVIHLCSIRRRPDSGERAEKLIDLMTDLAETVSDHFEPNYNAYVLALDAWAASGRKDADYHAIRLLERMQQLGENKKIAKLNIRALSTALTSISRSKSDRAAELSQKIFQRIVELYIEGDRSSSVNSRTYTNVLSCLARSNHIDASEKSIQLLHQIRELRDKGFLALELNTIAYNCALNLFAKRGLPDEAEEVLADMVQSASLGSPCAPNTVSYSCLCRAYAKSDKSNAIERCMAILADVEEKYENGHENLKPDARLFNAVLTALARAAQTDDTAADQAHELLKRMELSSVSDNPFPPDIVSYSTVCQAYAISSVANSAEKAEEILQEAENLAASGSLPYPERFFYSAVALAFSRNRTPNMAKAEEMIRRLEALHADGRKNTSRTTQTYNSLLNGWAHSQSPDKLEKANLLLREMKSRKGKNAPDVFSYNWVILAAAHSKKDFLTDTKSPFQVALDIFKGLHNGTIQSAVPNACTYCYFLKACHALLPAGKERDKLAAKAFELCKGAGLVSKEVWVESMRLVPDILKIELEKEAIKVKDATTDTTRTVLPDNWTYNVPKGGRVSVVV